MNLPEVWCPLEFALFPESVHLVKVVHLQPEVAQVDAWRLRLQFGDVGSLNNQMSNVLGGAKFNDCLNVFQLQNHNHTPQACSKYHQSHLPSPFVLLSALALWKIVT